MCGRGPLQRRGRSIFPGIEPPTGAPKLPPVEVLAQPASVNGSLKHIEWDGWGWGGQDFSVFLVFDPADSLSGPARSRQSGKLNGIPCEVSDVRRMDAHWYIVFFDGYVDQSSWDSCQ